MSEQEDEKRHKASDESYVVVMQQTAADKIKSYRHNELENEPGGRQKRSKTPVVPPVAEEIKNDATKIQTTVPADTQRGEKPERKKQELVSDGPRGQVSKILSAMAPAPGEGKGAETMALTNLQKDPVLKVIPPPVAPVDLKAVPSGDSVEPGKAEEHADEDSITDEIAELPTTATDKNNEWGLKSTPVLQQTQSAPTCSSTGKLLAPFGIALRLPQKCWSCYDTTANSGIHIVIPKRTFVRSSLTSQPTLGENQNNMPEFSDEDVSSTPHCMTMLRETFSTIHTKITQYFNK